MFSVLSVVKNIQYISAKICPICVYLRAVINKLDSRFHGNDMPFFIWNYLVTSRKFLYLHVTPFYHRVVKLRLACHSVVPIVDMKTDRDFYSFLALLSSLFFSVIFISVFLCALCGCLNLFFRVFSCFSWLRFYLIYFLPKIDNFPPSQKLHCERSFNENSI